MAATIPANATASAESDSQTGGNGRRRFARHFSQPYPVTKTPRAASSNTFGVNGAALKSGASDACMCCSIARMRERRAHKVRLTLVIRRKSSGRAQGGARLSQKQPAAGARAHPKYEIERVSGHKVADGGGNAPNAGIGLTVYRNVVLATMVNGKFEREQDGRRHEVPAMIQLDATSPDVSNLHWIHFFNEAEYDAGGNPVAGGSAEGETSYHETAVDG